MGIRVARDGTIIRDTPNQPNRNVTSQRNNQQKPKDSFLDRAPFVYCVITIVLSALVSWFLAGFVSVRFFDPTEAKGWLKGITSFISTYSSYAIFLAGIGGCFWYNVRLADDFNVFAMFLSVLFTLGACLIVGAVLYFLPLIAIIAIIGYYLKERK